MSQVSLANPVRFGSKWFINLYYMASSASGQDESNPALWLATRAGNMELSCPPGTTHRVPQEKFPRKPYNKSFIDQACSVKMAGYWPRSFFASLWISTPSRSIKSQKKNLANIQPSWPHGSCRFRPMASSPPPRSPHCPTSFSSKRTHIDSTWSSSPPTPGPQPDRVAYRDHPSFFYPQP